MNQKSDKLFEIQKIFKNIQKYSKIYKSLIENRKNQSSFCFFWGGGLGQSKCFLGNIDFKKKLGVSLIFWSSFLSSFMMAQRILQSFLPSSPQQTQLFPSNANDLPVYAGISQIFFACNQGTIVYILLFNI
jgi:hypothetical protein